MEAFFWISAVFGVILLPGFVLFLYGRRALSARKIISQDKKFADVFGFYPSNRSTDQKVVDVFLRSLAENFDELTMQERKIVSGPSWTVGAGETAAGAVVHMHVQQERLKDVQSALQEAKKAFWYAHGLAKEQGFEVRMQYSDYLPEPELTLKS